jgi:hypothetical protein
MQRLANREPPMPFTPVQKNELVKFQEDTWNSEPPQVTSYLAYDSASSMRVLSPICGFGWRFSIDVLRRRSSPLWFERGTLSTAFGTIDFVVMISCKDENFRTTMTTSRSGLTNAKYHLYDLELPSTTAEPLHIEITLRFNTGLSLPTLPHPSKTDISPGNIRMALRSSLRTPSFVDTKFYLFSAKVKGRPAHPRPVFAKSTLLSEGCTYLKDRKFSTHSRFSPGQQTQVWPL